MNQEEGQDKGLVSVKPKVFLMSCAASMVSGGMEGFLGGPLDKIKNNAVASRLPRQPVEGASTYLKRYLKHVCVGGGDFHWRTMYQGTFRYVFQKTLQRSIVFPIGTHASNQYMAALSAVSGVTGQPPSWISAFGGVAGGATAGVAEVLILQPIDTLKIRGQIHNEGIREAFRYMTQKGFLGAYAGAQATLVRNVLGSSASWGVERWVHHSLTPPGEVSTLGTDVLAASMFATTRILVSHVPEVVKVRQQAGNIASDQSVLSAIQDLVKQGGARELATGLGTRLSASGIKVMGGLLLFKQVDKKIRTWFQAPAQARTPTPSDPPTVPPPNHAP